MSGYKRLYDDFDVDTEIPVVEYIYEVNLKTSTSGFGPFAKVTGSITIENKTDYKKYQALRDGVLPEIKLNIP